MSYDIVAFDPSATTDSDYPGWYDRQAEWGEEHSYDDAAVTTPGLRAFYTEIIEDFPPMNGPDAPDLESLTLEAEGRLAEYSIGSRIIQASCRWPQAQRADELFRELAARHDVAIAWASAPSGTMPMCWVAQMPRSRRVIPVS